MIRLLLRLGDNPQPQEFRDDPITIGRSSRNGLAIADPLVSRCHARIERAGPGLRIVDLRSENGTRLNGRTIEAAPLQVGDALRIGSMHLGIIDFD